MRLGELLQDIVTAGEYDASASVSGIAYDSRKVRPGDVFVCIKGYQTDGHQYIRDAADHGAVAVVALDKVDSDLPVVYTDDTRIALARMANRFYGEPTKKFHLIGVTGTNGKTTVTYLIKTVLEQAGKKVGLIGTNQNMIGDKAIASEHTTPESADLYAMFDTMAAEHVEYVVMEVSSHALQLHRVEGCQFETAIFTNLTQDHLDFHGSMENYYAAKRKLFNMCQKAVINIDDGYGKCLAREVSCPAITYGIDNRADLQAQDIKISARGVTFLVEAEGQKMPVRLGIPGRFSVYNALAALGAGLSLSMGAEAVTRGLVIAKGVKGRAEVVNTGRSYTVLIDYAHTPDGLKNIISTVREFARGRVITLFGCGGDRDRGKRPLMGEVAGRLSDFCIVTTDNPRSEAPGAIIEQILEGITKTECDYVVVENRRDAIRYALLHAEPDDVIILAGKGHETYQILADRTIEFDERKVVGEILREMDAE